MYFLYGTTPNMQTIMVLVRSHLPQGQPLSETLVARAYRDYLTRLQPQVPASPTDGTQLIRDDVQASRLAELFGLPKETPPSQRQQETCSDSIDAHKASFFEAGLERIAQYDPELSMVFQMAVTSIFSSSASATPGSMTVRAALGAVWIYPLATWSTEDLVEAYIHELTHTLVMLDEQRFRHYPNYDQLDHEDNLVWSAIRSDRRSLFASAHSILVANELLQVRERHHGHRRDFQLHPPSREIRENTLRALDSALGLSNIGDLASPRLLDILEMAGRQLSAIQPKTLVS
ncbi:HEXXH motif-containing putative peptide modification protein [Streptomyces sp. SID12501]|uniref:HEXXH motif domain-containing protein n=1 Tax=Streptomyces sp. SID12501 TaxID=2706042 RepID=A0A6B3BPF9_9ACTN|nr:HEXXH motif-containing putative peptide modification protein [Streptomyces sp. SID12501]NEC86241.1 hypothetical protein [Streptomyces sp. SID12501]